MVLQPEEQKGGGKIAAERAERAVSPPRLSSEDGLKALALAAGADRLAQFSCDVTVSFISLNHLVFISPLLPAGMLPDLHHRGLAHEAQGEAAQRGPGLQRGQILLLSAVRQTVPEDQ